MIECCQTMEDMVAKDWITRLEYVDCSPAKDVFYHVNIIVGGEDYESLYFEHCPFCGAELC